jgi:hypothetical protein
MKAVAQHTIFSVICLAGMLLAAPYFSTSRPIIAKAAMSRPSPVLSQARTIAQPCTTQEPSLEDGSIRFACW